MPHDFAPRRERERFLERERERFLERERERLLERERDRFLPPLEHERFLERERDRVLPPLEHDLFLDRDLDRALPERDRFFEPERDFDLDFERDLEQLLALSAIAARRFLAMAFGQELQLLLAFPALLLRLLDRLFGRVSSSSSSSARLLRGMLKMILATDFSWAVGSYSVLLESKGYLL